MSNLTYEEVTKEIKKLSTKYHAKFDETHGSPTFKVTYKGFLVAFVDGRTPYLLHVSVYNFDDLPFSHKLWMILSELSMTPVDERVPERKWSVPICKTASYKVVWSKVKVPARGFGPCSTPEEPFSPVTLFNYTEQSIGVKDDYIFTDSEYKELLDYLHTLPDGNYQVEMAEHNKFETFV